MDYLSKCNILLHETPALLKTSPTAQPMSFKMHDFMIDNAAFPSTEKSVDTFVGLTPFEPTIFVQLCEANVVLDGGLKRQDSFGQPPALFYSL